MEKKNFIGIDISKLKIDAFILGKRAYKQFNNESNGFEKMVHWIKKTLIISDLSDCMICFEHTGIYSLLLAVYLEENAISFSMTSALQIKRSMGIARGKTDQIDAKRIAEFAFRFQDTLQQTTLPPKAIIKLQPLLTLRNRIVRARSSYEVTKKEQGRILSREDFPEIHETYDRIIITLKEETKKLENAIKNIVSGDEELKKTFNLITKIKGVGLIVGVYMITYTHNFTRFTNWRKFACFAGIAPFDFQSGSSVKGKTRVNDIANKQMKKILHLAAVSAAYNNKELSAYFQKRLQAGYNKMSTLNAIRNKVLARIFAVAKRQTEYVELMKHVA